jgi:hypothetical protein
MQQALKISGKCDVIILTILIPSLVKVYSSTSLLITILNNEFSPNQGIFKEYHGGK